MLRNPMRALYNNLSRTDLEDEMDCGRSVNVDQWSSFAALGVKIIHHIFRISI